MIFETEQEYINELRALNARILADEQAITESKARRDLLAYELKRMLDDDLAWRIFNATKKGDSA